MDEKPAPKNKATIVAASKIENQPEAYKGIAIYTSDSISSFTLIPRLLDAAGYRIVRVRPEKKLIIEEATKLLPDVIIMEELIPDESVNICQELKANALTKNIPIIYIPVIPRIPNIVNLEILREKVMATGVDTFLKGPVTIDQFLALLRSYLPS